MIKRILIALIAVLISATAFAQNFPYGNFIHQELELKKYDNDTAAHAVVLQEYGTTKIDVVSDDNIKIIHEYHVKIKLFDNKSFDKGTIEIPYYTESDNLLEQVDEIKGKTTYTDDNGSVHTADLDATKIVNYKVNKYWSNIKFAMPNLRNGCIIEYQYRVVTPFWDKFPSWDFQDDIPKVYSEYEVHIPAFWTYNASIKGYLKLTKNTSEVERACFTSHGAACDCSHIVFGMANIPAFIEEDYMTAPKNFKSAINFTLAEWVNPYTSAKIKVAKEWRDVDYNLKHADYFGSQIRRKDLLKQYITPVITSQTTPLQKAQAVYAYIQKNIKWNEYNNRGTDDGIKKALENHTGNAADINLALVSALNTAGINAEAILLSTRSNGLINRIYPVEKEFNYVIARAAIDKDTFLLDATDPLLAFGMLPLRCLNDQGRVMSMEKPSYWIDLIPKQRKSSTTSFDLTLQSNGKLKGTITTYYAGYEGYERRKAIKKFNTTDEYIENLDEKLTKIKITNGKIINLDSLDRILSEVYDVEIDAYDNLNHNRFAFNPFIFDRITNNPFKLNERTYPVDWGMPSDTRFILNMHLPADYVIESAPVGAALALPNQGGKFITNFVANNNDFSFSNVIQFNKSVYAPEEYPYLKEIYNKIIAAQKAEIVFKKKS
jgi:transglutaminase-like putative cysteine protease